jgi:hypothetical protein
VSTSRRYETSTIFSTSNQTQIHEEVAPLKFTTFDLPYSGLTKDQLKDLSVDDIFHKMKHNLKLKNNMDFETRC